VKLLPFLRPQTCVTTVENGFTPTLLHADGVITPRCWRLAPTPRTASLVRGQCVSNLCHFTVRERIGIPTHTTVALHFFYTSPLWTRPSGESDVVVHAAIAGCSLSHLKACLLGIATLVPAVIILDSNRSYFLTYHPPPHSTCCGDIPSGQQSMRQYFL